MFFWFFGKKKKKETVNVSVLEYGDTLKVKPVTENNEKTVADEAPAPESVKSTVKDATPVAENTESKATDIDSNKPKAKKQPANTVKENSSPEVQTISGEECEIDSEEGETVAESKHVSSGRFNIKRAKDGRYVFNLYAANKVMVATSQIYSSSQSAMVGVKSVMTNAAKAPIEDSTLKNPVSYPFPKWEVYIDRAGEFRFRLYATNGSCICHAKRGYATKASCKRGIESIIRLASEANIDKSYLVK